MRMISVISKQIQWAQDGYVLYDYMGERMGFVSWSIRLINTLNRA